MRTPLDRIRIGAVVLGVIIILAILGYHFTGYSLLEAIWMVTITLSSVGYSETPGMSKVQQILTIAVIIFGMSAAAYTIGGLLQMLTEGEIERALGRKRMTRDLENLQNHVIVCGFGRIGRVLADELKRNRRQFVLIEQNMDVVEETHEKGFLSIQGDATDEEVLSRAGIERAAMLVAALPNDAANVFITLTCRNLNPELLIIARAELKSTAKKLKQAGANRIVMPTQIGAGQIARLVLRPNTADVAELFSGYEAIDYELDEFTIPLNSRMVGLSVYETEANRRHRLLVVAVKQESGELIFNPDSDYQFQPRDTIILMGRTTDLRTFFDEFSTAS